ncbi:hypothetical protein ACFQZF_04875 [Flavobacterium myungsuense]|uniref:Uncharacterized protein n=1 Tax=Flavobacterium myungsuense TaxID=651823 RepID=A0ABW3IZS4_9FLAO
MKTTKLQKEVSRMWNIYPDETFIEMISLLDDPEYWVNVQLEELTDKECLKIIKKLGKIYSKWNR